MIDSARLVQALAQRGEAAASWGWEIGRWTLRVVLALCVAFWLLVVGAMLGDVAWSVGR